VLGADSRQAGNFILGENLLSGLDSDHSPPSSAVTSTDQILQKGNSLHHNTYFPSKSPAVCLNSLRSAL
jgi:hypothetical protein